MTATHRTNPADSAPALDARAPLGAGLDEWAVVNVVVWAAVFGIAAASRYRCGTERV